MSLFFGLQVYDRFVTSYDIYVTGIGRHQRPNFGAIWQGLAIHNADGLRRRPDRVRKLRKRRPRAKPRAARPNDGTTRPGACAALFFCWQWPILFWQVFLRIFYAAACGNRANMGFSKDNYAGKMNKGTFVTDASQVVTHTSRVWAEMIKNPFLPSLLVLSNMVACMLFWLAVATPASAAKIDLVQQKQDENVLSSIV